MKPESLSENFTVMVPVFNETTAFNFSKFYFDQLRIAPLYVLDSKNAAHRHMYERLLGREIPVYQNQGGMVEANFREFAAIAPTDWILRIDCDEAPNEAALAACRRFVKSPTSSVYGFDRDDLIWRGDHFERIAYPWWFFDSQYRLFNRNRVRFRHEVHTPGYHIARWRLPLVPLWHAPPQARIYHLQREFVSAAENRRKQQRYNAEGQDPKFNAAMLQSADKLRWRDFDDAEFTALFAGWKKSSDQ